MGINSWYKKKEMGVMKILNFLLLILPYSSKVQSERWISSILAVYLRHFTPYVSRGRLMANCAKTSCLFIFIFWSFENAKNLANSQNNSEPKIKSTHKNTNTNISGTLSGGIRLAVKANTSCFEILRVN